MMKRFFNYTFMFVLVGYIVPTMPMDDPFDNFFRDADVNGIARDIGQGVHGGINDLDEVLRNRAEQAERRRLELQRQANNLNATQEARALAAEQLRSQMRTNEQWENVGATVRGKLADAYINIVQAPVEMIKERARAGHKLQEEVGKAAATASVTAEANKEMLQKKMDFIKEPKNLATIAGGVGLTVLAGYGAYQGLKLLSEIVSHMYRNPRLAKESSLLTLGEKIEQFFMGKKIEPKKVSDVILTPELEKQMAEIEAALKKSVATDDFLFNILLWGPPGTGKTMLAERLARSSGLDYILFAASDLDQLSLEEALIKLRELFDFAKKKNQKLVIVVDEIEKLLPSRENELSEKTGKLLTQMLAYTGTETSDYMIIGMTNRPQDLDEAFLSRCDYQVFIDTPDITQRSRIVKKYVTDYILTTPPAQRVPTLFGRIANTISKPKPTPRLGVAPDAVNDAMIQEIAKRTEGFVGRDLAKMVFEMRRRAQVSSNKTLTKEMVNDVVTRWVNQRAQGDAGFLRKDVPVKSTSPSSAFPRETSGQAGRTDDKQSQPVRKTRKSRKAKSV